MKHFLLIAFTAWGSCSIVQAQSWWAQNSSTQVNLMDIDFDNSFIGYAFGDTMSTIVKTTNQGFTWSVLTPSFQLADLRAGAVINGSIVVAAGIDDSPGGDGVVIRTSDGGATWTTDTSIPEKLFGIHFPTISDGWTCGENGYIGRSNDGGFSWLQLTTGTGEDVNAIYFIDANEGWAVGTGDPIAIVLHTTNGGTNWSMQNSTVVDDPLNGVFFLDTNMGWACGSAGNIITTTDGGATWTSQTSGTIEDLNDIQFLDANNGWCVGSGGAVLRTTDGGLTWTTETSGTSQDIFGVHMRSTTLGWFAGDGGTIHVYGNNPPDGVAESPLNEHMLVYPNPTTGMVTLDLSEGQAPKQLEILGMDGRVIERRRINSKVSQISLETLTPGTYFLKLQSLEDGSLGTRLVTKY